MEDAKSSGWDKGRHDEEGCALTYLHGNSDSISGAGGTVSGTLSGALQAQVLPYNQSEVGESHRGIIVSGTLFLPSREFVTDKEARLERENKALREQLRLVTNERDEEKLGRERETRRAKKATDAAYYRETGQTDEYAYDGWGDK